MSSASFAVALTLFRNQYNQALQAEQEFVVSLGSTHVQKLGDLHPPQALVMHKTDAIEPTAEDRHKVAEDDEESSQKDDDTDESDDKPKKKRRKGLINK